MNEEDGHDAHLLAALRHAPDRDATPPREVSERILAAARAAVQPSVPAWKRWLDWVAQPQVAGAFGTIAIATVVGLMWATREPPPVEVERPVAAAPRAVIEQDAAPLAASAALGGNAPVPAAESPRAVPVPRRDVARRNEAAPAPIDGRAEARAAAPLARTDALAEKLAQAASPASAEKKVEAPALAAAPPPVAQTHTTKEATVTGGAMADAATTGRVRAAASVPGQVPTPSFAPLAKARPAEPLTSLDAAVQAAPAWVTPVGRRAQGDAQRQWWSAVQAATAGRWQAIDSVPAAAPALTLELDGGAVVRFWFDADAMVVADTQGRPWRAAVGAPTVRDWEAELARW